MMGDLYAHSGPWVLVAGPDTDSVPIALTETLYEALVRLCKARGGLPRSRVPAALRQALREAGIALTASGGRVCLPDGCQIERWGDFD